MSFCGLDFGTSNSTIGFVAQGKAVLAPLEDGKPTLPSAIFFDTEEHVTSFGRKAIFEYTDGAEGRLMRALKSVLGTSLMQEKTQVGNKMLAFSDILGLFIAQLKRKAEQSCHTELNHVVMGRPVFFVDDNPEADQLAQNTLEQIAKTQGFSHVQFQYEPIAAALDYEQTLQTEKLALIVDLGGGTSDFSIVKVGPQQTLKADRSADILANTGVHIGGTDFDRLLSLSSVMPHLGYGSTMKDPLGEKELEIARSYFYDLATWQKINFVYTIKTLNEVRNIHRCATQKQLLQRLLHVIEERKGHSIALEVEQAKIQLTEQPQAYVPLHWLENGLSVEIKLAEFEAAIAEQVQRLQNSVSTALVQAGVTPEAIDTVFLTGGSTAIPHIRQTLLTPFPHAEVIEGDRFGSVGLGLTVAAQRVYG